MEFRRFSLSAEQLSEGFASMGNIPFEPDMLPNLPRASGMLPAEIAGEDGNLDLAIRQILSVLAKPHAVLRARYPKAGEIEEILVLGSGAIWVAYAPSDSGGWIFATFDRARARALLDRLTELGERTGSFAEVLDAVLADPLLAGDEVTAICSLCGTLYEDPPTYCRQCGGQL